MTKTKSNRTPSKRTPLLTVCLVKMGSLPAAIALISALGCILILSTLLESRMGTAFAQRFFYQAGWFDTLLALLGLNILCATLLRLPFQRRHIAFVTTHTGILILLAGSLVTRLQSVEGQMTLYENESSGQVRLDQYQLTVHSKDDNLCPAGLSLSPGKIPRDTAIGSNLRLSVLEMLENASQETDVTEGPPASPSNPAIRLTLVSVHQNVEETFWLIRKNPLNPASDSASLGPLSVELKNSRPKELLKNPMLELSRKNTDRLRIDLSQPPAGALAVGQSGYRLVSAVYYPDARVDGKKLVNVSDEPVNPAVEFEVENAAGQRCRYVKFARFPDFDSIHKPAVKTFEDLQTAFSAPEAEPQGTSSLRIYFENGQWSYAARSDKKESDGTILEGQSYPLGFMDFTFRTDRLLTRAAVSKKILRGGTGPSGGPAARLALVGHGKTLDTQWAMAGSPANFFDGKKTILVMLEPKTLTLPFSLTLKAFRKIDYPGTHNPSAYESDVVLKDPRSGLTLERTIAMNRTLDYEGYRIFQTSFLQEAHGAQASIFTVAKNPGIWLIYCGCLVMFAGICIGFYLTPAKTSNRV